MTSSFSPGSFIYSGSDVTDTCEGVRRGLRCLRGALVGFTVVLLPLPVTSALLIPLVSWSAAVAVAVRVRLAVALALAIWVAREWRRKARPRQPRAARLTKTTKITTVGV